MGTETQAIRLLILDDSLNNAERIVSVLRNAGHATRAHRITSVEDLQECLQQNWDLCIATPETSFMSAQQAFGLIGPDRDIPFILQVAEPGTDTLVEALRSGMKDVIPANSDPLLTLVAQRELASLAARRHQRIAEQALREAEKRCQLLLDSSVDAIAYVHDGMHIYANESYLSRFGYADIQDIICIPFIDLVEEQDREVLKTTLSHVQQNPARDTNGDTESVFEMNGQCVDGQLFHGRFFLRPTVYEGENCLQVVVHVAESQHAPGVKEAAREKRQPDADDATNITLELPQVDERLDVTSDTPEPTDAASCATVEETARLEQAVRFQPRSLAIFSVMSQLAAAHGAVNLGQSLQYNTPDLVRNTFGPLTYDTPHRIKLDGFYSFDLRDAGRLTLGTSFRFASGYPISLRVAHARFPGAYPSYLLPRGSGGRVTPNYTWNLSVSYAYPLRRTLELEVACRLINVTNARATLRVDEVYSFQNARPVAGGDLSDLKHAKVTNTSNPNAFFDRTVVAKQGNYGVEQQFQLPLAASFEVLMRF